MEILSIGNELLIGHTLDTNSYWIAKQLLQLGWTLQRITKIRDDLEEIKKTMRESLNRHPRVLITLGGLGPTHDDMTLKGVALALGRALELNPGAMRLVKQRYSSMNGQAKWTRYRKKMATIPRGSLPLPNPIGTAPGVLSYKTGTVIFSLPGVPSEMKAIFAKSIRPFFKNAAMRAPVQSEMRISGIIESKFASILDRTRKKYPGLYFKSHPRGRETGGRPVILLHIYNIQPEGGRKIIPAADDIIRNLSSLSSPAKP